MDHRPLGFRLLTFESHDKLAGAPDGHSFLVHTAESAEICLDFERHAILQELLQRSLDTTGKQQLLQSNATHVFEKWTFANTSSNSTCQVKLENANLELIVLSCQRAQTFR
eukprot:14122777-Alexandrium_andersonii.AAC.1